MVVQIAIPQGDRRLVIAAARHLVEAVASINHALFRAGLIPPLYSTRVLYRPEPEDGLERFDNAQVVLKRGNGDCDDLVAYRLGELWAAGETGARARIVGRKGESVYHAQLRRGDGSIEDPCIIMRRKEAERATRAHR